jgi:hypothetical protein
VGLSKKKIIKIYICFGFYGLLKQADQLFLQWVSARKNDAFLILPSEMSWENSSK